MFAGYRHCKKCGKALMGLFDGALCNECEKEESRRMKNKDYEQLATKIIMNTVEGVKAQIRKAYDKGLEDAWDAAKKLCQSVKYGGLEEHCSEIFRRNPFETFDVFDYTATEALAKIKAYEDEQDAEIKVGDEVTHDGAKFIVLNIDSQTSVYCLDTRGRTPIFASIHNLTKTGRHFDQIAEVLAELRGTENDT